MRVLGSLYLDGLGLLGLLAELRHLTQQEHQVMALQSAQMLPEVSQAKVSLKCTSCHPLPVLEPFSSTTPRKCTSHLRQDTQSARRSSPSRTYHTCRLGIIMRRTTDNEMLFRHHKDSRLSNIQCRCAGQTPRSNSSSNNNPRMCLSKRDNRSKSGLRLAEHSCILTTREPVLSLRRYGLTFGY